jgi:hypothetical protein
MALETLKGRKTIMGEPVRHVSIENNEVINGDANIVADHNFGELIFKLQRGPVEEVGKNGCQVDHIIATAREIIARFNVENPCCYNDSATNALDEALGHLAIRTAEREERGVEGTSKE